LRFDVSFENKNSRRNGQNKEKETVEGGGDI
jgi:hypothetical protein